MGLIDWVFGGRSQPKVPPKDEEVARVIVDRVVAATDKRLRGVGGYQKALREPALATLAFIRRFATDIPGPVDVGATAWTDDPKIRALFAKPQDVPATFSRDAGVRKCLADGTAADCYAILGLKHEERQVFAPAQRGDTIQQEVAQTTVNFGDARILFPGPEPLPVRVELAKRAVDYLALRALERITAEEKQRKDLEQERALLKARLQLAQQRAGGLAHIAASTAVAPAATGLAAKLAANEKALAAYAPTGLMTRFLDILGEVLSDPGAHIRLDTCTLALDAMNYRVPDEASASVVLNLHELRLGDGPRWAIMLARFPRAELLPAEDALAQAEKYL